MKATELATERKLFRRVGEGATIEEGTAEASDVWGRRAEALMRIGVEVIGVELRPIEEATTTVYG